MICIDDRVDATIVEQFGIDERQVVATARIEDDFVADWYDVLALVMALEDEFAIEISDEEADRCETVQDVRNLIHIKLGVL